VNKKQKIFVGISGGVDSSVAAFLLQQQGYDVQGIFVKTWSPEWVPCTWVDEKRDAMRICAALDIPFHFLDASEEYKQGVADYMIGEYKIGRTPNPDVLCNKVIKFGAMWRYAQAHGADGIATGHYCRKVEDPEHHSMNVSMMRRAVDPAKDQSYFLWMIDKDILPNIYFPIGHLHKNEVRKIAEKAGLFTAGKKDSQGICFLGEIDMKDFLRHYIDERAGAVLNEEGTVVGEHDGVWFYTLGERHGFRITEKVTDRTPYYIVAKDIEKNTLTVAHSVKDAHRNGETVTIRLRHTNWFVEPTIDTPYTAQIRYHGVLLPAMILDNHTVTLTCDEPIPLGQSIVIYQGEKVIGGGVIDFIL
jgi:tRNA-specific 2-thiouridylase